VSRWGYIIGMELKESVVKARIEPSLKHETEEILHNLGLTTTDAIRMFFHQIRLHRGIPYPVQVPSKETLKAIDELESGKGERFDSVDDLFADSES